MPDPTIPSEPSIHSGICYAIFAYYAARRRRGLSVYLF